jgi:thermostable 8-oxoguanine DNA glycosylase
LTLARPPATIAPVSTTSALAVRALELARQILVDNIKGISLEEARVRFQPD